MTFLKKKWLLAAAILAVGVLFFFVRPPQDAGIDSRIIVEMKACADIGGNDGCYEKAASELVSLFSFQEILGSLARVGERPEVFSRCHELTHYLGRSAYDANPDIPALYGEGSPVCHGGFYHGVIEGYFKARYPGEVLQDSEAMLAKDVAKVCGNIKDYPVPRFYGECVHGVGHAMMLVTSEDLPRALRYCDVFREGLERDACYGGVIMQNSWGLSTQGHSTEYLKKDDPMYPCTTLEGAKARACYAYQAFYFAELSKWDWKEVAALCRAEPKEYQGGCFTVTGLLLVEHMTDTAQYYATCTLAGESALVRSCVQGVVDSLGGRYVGDSVPMDAFCASVAEEDKSTCYIGMGSAAATWSQDSSESDKACFKFANAATKDACLSGAALTKARISSL